MYNNKLKMRRQQLGYTQKELAEKANINKRTYERYENGYNSIGNMSAKALISICAVLQCKPEDLF